jgi:gamma-glutamyltranspeptidase/glutathione hydrolase
MIRVIAFILTTVTLIGTTSFAAERAVIGRNGMVVSVSPPASDVGVEILKNGGNAVDAAVATAFALAVTHPAAGNIGGGGFMLVHPTHGDPVVFEYRETAPASAHAQTFVRETSTLTHKAVGVPGTVRGMALAHKRFGKMPWKDIVAPAVKLAADGFVIGEPLARSLNDLIATSADFPELRRVFGKPGNGEWNGNDRLVQPDLARTLRLIADDGPDAFYRGLIADQIVDEMKAGGGQITKADLESYRAVERKPIHGTYRGYDIYGPPPPSSGGICLVQMLNVLEQFDLRSRDRYAPETVHLMAEAMRRAFADRARFIGDPAFTKIPEHLTTKEYARQLAKSISMTNATPSAALAGDIKLPPESDDTTHFSVIDKDGLAVSNTYTLEHSFGSRVVVRGAGFLLNNEMSDFNWKPGITDRRGRIGTPPNLVAPGKRMLSSQSPTIVSKHGRPILITGSPGSRTIINTVLCVLVNVIDYGMEPQAAVDAPRMHHQWFPDEIRLERSATFAALSKSLGVMGHTVGSTKQGDAHTIWINPADGTYHGAADKRITGKASGY